MKTAAYPHITRNKAILGGIPIVTGTRTSVRSIAGYYQMGMSVDEILQSLPHLSEAQQADLMKHYLGFTTWQEIVTRFGLPSTLLADPPS